MNENAIEQATQTKSTGARVTPDQVEHAIIAEQYHVFPGTTMTVCCLTLRNGFAVIGEACCVSPANFDEARGRNAAREDAKRKIWMLEGYMLRQRLFEFG